MPPVEQKFSTRNVDYLQRTGEFTPGASTFPHAPQETIFDFVKVLGVGRLDKSSASEIRQTAVTDWQLTQLISENLLIGLYAVGSRIAFLIDGEPGHVGLYLGISRSAKGAAGTVDGTQTLTTILNGVYPGIELDDSIDQSALVRRELPMAGLVLGIPTAKPPDLTDGAFAIDRLIRSLAGTTWRALVLAEPIPDQDIRDLRTNVISEMRVAQGAAAAAGTPSPLADHYTRLLSIALDEFTNAQAVGGWRTSVYLISSADSFTRLAGAWRSVFSGSTSLPEPMRVWPLLDAGVVKHWAMPAVEEVRGPGAYHHPYKFQTVLSSSQLAAYVHLPQLETRGFTVKRVPGFDVVPAIPTSTSLVKIGMVVDRTQPSDVPYTVPTASLASHVFVTGMTGGGKTNTVIHLLREAFLQRVNFLVIEPAKREYRCLLKDDRLGTSLRVFTSGVEHESPLRLNPFEILRGSSLSVHLDLLRSVFASSFGMWVPLPQILEKCLVAVYQDKGWDIVTGKNSRCGSDWSSSAFPTLSDLVAKVEEVVPTLGFDPEAKGRILASLTSRLNGLRSAGKGKMLDVQESFPIEALLSSPTVLELEGMGDDDDKAFLIGLLLIRLFELRAIEGNRDELQHLLVIEEAHRILTNVARSSNQEQADPRGKAVESFTNLLSEIRSYGQGVVISDQVPTRLAPDVLKNTNLKICHRIVSGDDREILGKTMAMSERQIGALNSLTTDKIRNMNQAVVFSGELDDAPILVEVEYVKPPVTEDVRSGRAVIQRAVAGFNANTLRLLRPTAACHGICDRDSESADATRALETDDFDGLHNVLQKDPECSIARRALDVESCRSAVAKLVVSFIENPGTVETLWRDVCAAAAAHRRNGMDEHRLHRCLAVRAAAWISDRRGAQARWSYAQTSQFEAALRTLLLVLADGTGQITATKSFREASDQFRRVASELHARTFSPYQHCERICSQGKLPTCLYRFGAADELAADAMKPAREKAASLVLSTEGKEELWREAVKAGCRMIAVPNDVDDEGSRAAVEQSLIRASLCVAQQLLGSAPNVHARDADFVLEGFLKQGQNV